MSEKLIKCCDSTFTLNNVGDHIIASHGWKSTDKIRCTCKRMIKIKGLFQHFKDAKAHTDGPDEQRAIQPVREQRNSSGRSNAEASAAPKPEQQRKKPGNPPQKRNKKEWQPPKVESFASRHANCRDTYCVWVEDDCPEAFYSNWMSDDC